MAELKIDSDFFDAFRSLMVALKDYNNDIIVIGGFANALYEYHEKGQPSPLGTLVTKDMDLLVSQKVTIINESILKQLTDNGFEIEHKPIEDKYLTKFILPTTNFEIEFLCPLVGGDPDRHGNKQLVKEVQGGLMAQPLRYLDIAQYEPWIINTENVPVLKELNLNIQIPSPGAYLIQKFIIRGDRRPAYLQKDCFYMYELLLKFNSNLSELGLSVENVVFYNDKKTNYSKVKSFKVDFVNYFKDKKSVGITKVMQELKDRGINDINEDDVIGTFQDFFKLLEAKK